MKGLFITFEGGEGAGKSTLIHRLFAYFRDQKLSCMETIEPGGTPFGKQIRKIVLESNYHLSAQSETLLFLADRSHHISEKIKPALKQGHVVLCDRFADSTRAYQGAAGKLNLQFLEEMITFACDGLQPDLTFYLDLDPGTGLARTTTNGFDRIEQKDLSFHQNVRKAFLSLAEKHHQRIIVIDASLSKEEVLNIALKEIIKRFGETHALKPA